MDQRGAAGDQRTGRTPAVERGCLGGGQCLCCRLVVAPRGCLRLGRQAGRKVGGDTKVDVRGKVRARWVHMESGMEMKAEAKRTAWQGERN